MEIIILIIVIAVISLFIYKPLRSNALDDNSSNVSINKQKLQEQPQSQDETKYTQMKAMNNAKTAYEGNSKMFFVDEFHMLK